MKYVVLIIGLMSQLSCVSLPKEALGNYRIVDVKQHRDTYVIYALSSNDDKYKIVSGSDTTSSCLPLQIGRVYKLTLIRLRQGAPEINGVKLDPASPARKTCMTFGDNEICTEPEKGMYELYTAGEIHANYYCNRQ